MFMVTINRKKVYDVRVETSEGKWIMSLCGIVIKKKQARELLGISSKVEETLVLDGENYDITMAPEVLAALIKKKRR
jgi:hypothetical protein